MEKFDFVIIGAGIAGASLAAELAAHARVLVLEMEDRPGVHATGRSAAFWMESYGGPKILPLTRASGPWLDQHGFMRPRGGLHIARQEEAGLLASFEGQYAGAGIAFERLKRDRLAQIVPGVRPAWVEALLEPSTCDIDVAALHAHYLGAAQHSGAVLRCRAGLARAVREDGGWRIEASDGTIVRGSVLVNAAGAWADNVARSAEVRPLGIQPLRRTMAQLRLVQPVSSSLPLVLGIDGSFYFKPEAGRIWLTPHDEHPSLACDAAPEEFDIAMAIDRFEDVVHWPVAALEHKWAGLRSFAPDRVPVYGFDREKRGFFWFVGQGGFGIQTAPAAARLAAQILLGQPSDSMTDVLDPEIYAASRPV